MPILNRNTLFTLVLPLLLIIGGCSENPTEAEQIKTASAATLKPEIENTRSKLAPDPLNIIDATETLFQGRPALSLNFTVPLDALTGYDTWVDVYDAEKHKVNASWVLSESAKNLYFLGISAKTQYSITVRKGMVAQNGQVLESTRQFEVSTNNLKATAGFSGKGKIIPAGIEAGLPVRSINVALINVDFFKVPTADFQSLMRRLDTASSYSNYSIDSLIGRSTRVLSAKYELPNTLNKAIETKLPLNQKITNIPGIYVAIMRRDGVYQYTSPITWFTVSDIGLHLRQYKNQWSVFTSELASSEVNGGVEVRILNEKNELIAQGVSDNQGRLDLAMQTSNDARLLLATKGSHLALLSLTGPALDISEFDLPSKPFKALEYFIYGPRDIYRPGEELEFSVLLRDSDGQLIPPAPLAATLLRPNGTVANRQTLSPMQNGFYSYHYPLASSASTGQWTLQVSLIGNENSRASKLLRVEDFMPERIRLDFSAKAGTMLTLAQLQSLSVQADYLYGAPAAGNETDTELYLSAERTPFPTLRGFEFGAIADPADNRQFVLDLTQLDQSGSGSLKLNKYILENLREFKGPAKLEYRSSVYESGGRPIQRSLKVFSWQGDIWPGIKAGFDTHDNTLVNQDVLFELLATSASGLPIKGRALKVELIKLNRKAYWEYIADDGWRYKYAESPKLSWEQSLTTQSEPLLIRVPVSKGYYLLQVTDSAGKQSSTEFNIGQDWWGNALADNAARPDKISITFDKPAYAAGDTIELQLASPRPGKGFLIVENSDGILYSQRISLGDDARTFSITLPADNIDWRRHDIRIVALTAQPEQQARYGIPMRSLGIQSIPLDREDRKIALSIQSSDTVEPNTVLKIRLKNDQFDENMMVTISAVDLGVLSVSNFQTPDPFDFFYQTRRAQVDARDNFSDVLHVRDLAFAKQRSGGDTGPLTRGGERPESRVLIVSLFQGPVRFDENGYADIEFKMPDFNGAVRIMVSAFSASHFGATDKEVIVKAPIVTQLSMPRFAAYGDQTQLTLDIHNTLDESKTLRLEWQLDGAHLASPAQKITTLKLAKNQKKTIKLPVFITRATGHANIQLHTSGDNIQFMRQWSLGLRPAHVAQTYKRVEYLESGQATEPDMAWLDGKLADSLQLQLSISPNPSLNTAEQWNALLRYPYGCLEQTTSRARPLAIANQQTRERWQVQLPKNLDRVAAVGDAINRLQTMQRTEGGFGLWSAQSPEEYWLTAYVTDFLLSAREKGFQVPQVMLDKAIKRLQFYVTDTRIQTSSRYYGNTVHYRFAYRAYAAYVLAKLSRAPLGSIRQWFDSYSNESQSPLPLIHLAIALKLQGDGERAAKAISLASTTLRKQNIYLGDYGSDIRDMALALALSIKYKLQLDGATLSLIKLSKAIYRRNYLSTQERDSILQLALALESKQSQSPWAARLKLVSGYSDIQSHSDWSTIVKGADAASVSITVEGERKLFVSQTLIAQPLKAPDKQFYGFSIKRRWFDTHGLAITDNSFETGDFIIVQLSVTADKRSPDAMVVDMLPAGFELENPGLKHATPLSAFSIGGVSLQLINPSYSTKLKHTEYRDDRFIAALDLEANRTVELTYLMRAVTPGSYQVPSAFVEDMYRPEYRAVGVAFSDIQIKPKNVP